MYDAPLAAVADEAELRRLETEQRYDGKRHDLTLDVGGHDKNAITFAPSLHISREEIDLALKLPDQLFRRCA